MKFIGRYKDTDIPIEVVREGHGYRVTLADRILEVDLVYAGWAVRSLRLLRDGTQYSLVHNRTGNVHEILMQGSRIEVEIVDPLALRRKSREDAVGEGGVVRALMPGRIVRLLVESGQAVQKGTGLLILEAMKMENEIQAPTDGTVEEIFVKPGETVESGAALVHLAPEQEP